MTGYSKLIGVEREHDMPRAAVRQAESEDIESTGVFSDAEARQLFERTAQRYLQMSTDEFLRRWDAKAFEPELQARAGRVASLIPLIRNIRAGQKSF